MTKPGPDDDGDLLVKKAPKVRRAPKYAVVFWNDDYTQKWFVVHLLEQVFHMSETSATAFMMAVHKEGRGIAGTYTRDIAETKAELSMQYAREYEMPLRVTAEPDERGGD